MDLDALAAKETITAQDLIPELQKMKTDLISKTVS